MITRNSLIKDNGKIFVEGFTLLELLIYMVIGTIIMSAGIMIFKNSAAQRHSVARAAELHQESFLASSILSQQFGQIGYRQIDETLVSGRAIPLATLDSGFPEVSGKWVAGQIINGTADSIIYRFQGASNADLSADNTIFDCSGLPVSAGTTNETLLTYQNNQLHCTTGGQTNILIGINDSVEVEQLIFVLGVDNNNDGAVDKQVPSVTASNSDFINARQITARLLLASVDNAALDVHPYQFNNQDILPSDRKLRFETEVTVTLRN